MNNRIKPIDDYLFVLNAIDSINDAKQVLTCQRLIENFNKKHKRFSEWTLKLAKQLEKKVVLI